MANSSGSRQATSSAHAATATASATSKTGEASSNDAKNKSDLPAELPEVLPIICGDHHAVMHRSKLGQGSRGPCILFHGEWITPNQFQAVAGRTTSKDWKRSIRYDGMSIKRYIKLGLIHVHEHTCTCTTCATHQPTAAKAKRKSWRRTLTSGGRKASDDASGSKIDNAVATNGPVIGESVENVTVSEEDVRPGVKVWSNAVLEQESEEGNGKEVEEEREGKTKNCDNGDGFSDQKDEDGDGDGSGESRRKRPYTVYSDGSPTEKQEPCHILSFPPNSKRMRRGSVCSSLGPFLPKSAVDATSGRSVLAQTFQRMDAVETSSILAAEWKDLRRIMLRANVPLTPSTWTIEQVCSFLRRAGFASCCPVFKDNHVDGEALMLIRETHLLNSMQMKVGPALKLFAIISRLQAL
eukprot:m.27369 g.27369  ORF g.27369 m.27369 type:complete len:410 (+) comp29941_c0_seq3:53-1282(+)